MMTVMMMLMMKIMILVEYDGYDDDTVICVVTILSKLIKSDPEQIIVNYLIHQLLCI